MEEVLAYHPDGIFFDWIRTGDVRDNPQTDAAGVAVYGYELPNIERFRELYHVDPHAVPNGDDRWVAVRAEPQTIFMREARRLIRQRVPGCEVAVLVQHRFGYRGSPDDTAYDGSLRGLLVDLKAWAEEGLIDAAVAAVYPSETGQFEKRLTWNGGNCRGGFRTSYSLIMGGPGSPNQWGVSPAVAKSENGRRVYARKEHSPCKTLLAGVS